MRRIGSEKDLTAGLDALAARDPRLAAVRARAGAVPLRLVPPGFASLSGIVIGQQVSRASATAILGRLEALVDPLTPQRLLASGEHVMRQAGLSRAKERALGALAEAVMDGLDLEALCEADGEEAIRRLCIVPGIGRWTAECYLLFAAGHADVFPARDVALQSAVGHGLGLEGPRPGEKALIALAESWAPLRSVAARLFWAYYREMRGRDAAPVPKTA